jgi:hypothetical protein
MGGLGGCIEGTEAKGYKAYDSWWELVQWCVEKSSSEPINAVLVTQEVVDFDKLGFKSTCRHRFFIPVKGYIHGFSPRPSPLPTTESPPSSDAKSPT